MDHGGSSDHSVVDLGSLTSVSVCTVGIVIDCVVMYCEDRVKHGLARYW